jgi:hypothetical protein
MDDYVEVVMRGSCCAFSPAETEIVLLMLPPQLKLSYFNLF